MNQFTTQYKKLGKHRKKCRFCGKLIQDGESVRAEQRQAEKYYPVKGIMKFSSWIFAHSDCAKTEEEKHG